MNKDVVITLRSVQHVDSNSAETELITEAKYRTNDDGGYSITYKESAATGFEGSTTEVSCYGNKYATIFRTGPANSNLVIDAEKKQHCHYGTPYGDFVVGIYTHKIESTLDDNGGDLYMKYTVDINSSYVSDNEIFLNVRENGGVSKSVELS